MQRRKGSRGKRTLAEEGEESDKDLDVGEGRQKEAEIAKKVQKIKKKNEAGGRKQEQERQCGRPFAWELNILFTDSWLNKTFY